MKSTTKKNALLGIAIALVAAYMFPVVLVTLLEGWQGILLFFSAAPLMGLLYTFWLVIPLGAALGMLIPQMAHGKNRWTAALQGAGFGAIGGLATAFCFISTSELRKGGGVLWILVIAYCALWVGGYAFYLAKNQSLYR
jgi:hypothetical protein